MIQQDFLKAKNDKGVRSLLFIYRDSKPIMRLCIEVPIKYTGNKETVFIEADTEYSVSNFSSQQKEIKEICFHLSVYNENYVRNFLNQIKKDSKVKFRVVAYNTCDTWEDAGLVSHQLYGIIDNKEYFLYSYVGKNNTASPVK